MSDTYFHEANTLIQKAGKSGFFQIYSSVFIIGYALVCYYCVTSVPLQKFRPEAECSLKNEIPPNFVKCTSENYCDPNYIRRYTPAENDYNNWYTDFKIDCNTECSFDFLISCVFCASFISMIILSSLPDTKGRKKLLIVEVSGIISVLIISLFTSGIKTMTVLWIIYEFFNHIYCVLTIYASETMSQEYYTFVCSTINICFPLSGFLNSLLFYCLRDWRLVHLVLTIMAISCGLLFKYIAVETPQYNLNKLDTQTFVKSREKISTFNGTYDSIKKELETFSARFKNLEPNSIEKIERYEGTDTSFYEVLKKDRNLLKEFMIISFAFTTVQFIIFGVLLNIEKFDDNVIVFSIILYSSEITAEMISGYLAQKYGRIKILQISFYLCAISFLLFHLMSHLLYLGLLFCFMGNFGIASSFNVIIIFISELFDVKIRSAACSYSRIPGKLAVIISPYVMSYLSSPFVLFSVMSILSGCLINQCKETLVNENIINRSESYTKMNPLKDNLFKGNHDDCI
jgi:MFS family permease